jgi:mannose-6-phosphate isomerase-like protein (cupin superfamily)
MTANGNVYGNSAGDRDERSGDLVDCSLEVAEFFAAREYRASCTWPSRTHARSMRTLLAVAVLAMSLFSTRVGRSEEPTFRGDIQKMTRDNSDFRRVLFTGRNVQVVAMSLRAGEDIGEEVHKVDQCFFFVDGKAQSIVKGNAATVSTHGVLCVPAGTRHNIRNTGSGALKLYTIYAPPQHPPKTVHRTKADAERAEGKGSPKTRK